MRILGTLLLLGGFLLCTSLVWAAVGFLMMGFGLICLLVAERRKKQLKASIDALSDRADRRQEPPPQIEKQALPAELPAPAPSKLAEPPPGNIDSRQAPSSFPEPGPPRPPKLPGTSRKQQPNRRPNEPNTIPYIHYDLEKWRALAKSDADVSRAVDALQPFGKKYVDQLAMAYLAFEEKSYLPAIVKLVANAVKKDSGSASAAAMDIDGDPNTDLISFTLNKVRTTVVEQVFASPALNDGFAETSSMMTKAPPQNESDARAKLASPVQSELKTPRSPTEAGAGSTKRQPDANRVDERRPVSVLAPVRKVTVSIDDASDLTDLFNRIA
jgi:hypothetical protein